MQALILVDIQNDFLPGGALAVPEGDLVVPVANRLQARFARVIATRDWHPVEHGSFADNHRGKKPGDQILLGGQPQILWPVHCVQGTSGAELAPGLETRRIEKTFYKGIDPEVDSYSAFFDNAAVRSTGLGEYLQGTGVTRVVLLGLATDYCVKFSALDALRLGLETLVVEDGCRGVNLNPQDAQRALESMREAGAKLVRSADLLATAPLAVAPPVTASAVAVAG